MQLSPFALLDRWLAPAPIPDKVSWIGRWVFAHRGLHGPGNPENSHSAFAAALDRGLGIECDIQRSRDGMAMVFHDAELDRLTALGGPVADRNARELQSIALLGSEDTIPSLRQVLDQVSGRAPILIEIKSPSGSRGRIGALCMAVRRELEGYMGTHAIMSFDPRIVRWFKRNSPMTVRGLVVSEENDKALAGMIRRHLLLWHAKPDFLAYDIRDLPSGFAAAQRRRGLAIATWTVRSAEHRERAAAYADAPIGEGSSLA